MPETKNIESTSTTKWVIILISIAFLVIAILFLIYNPDTLKKLWLWIIGLIGPIIGIVKSGIQSLGNLFGSTGSQQISKQPNITESNQTPENSVGEEPNKKITELESQIIGLEKQLKRANKEESSFNGTTITALRYFDDGQTTLGLLFIDGKYFCYTLEDTFHEKKIKGETRIPAGTYKVDFRKENTPLTEKYRETRPWFDFHIEIRNVPHYSGVYIHCGSNHEHTEGCLLVADSLYSSSEKRSIFNSRKTYEELYQRVKKIRSKDQNIRIQIFDEIWFRNTLTK